MKLLKLVVSNDVICINNYNNNNCLHIDRNNNDIKNISIEDVDIDMLSSHTQEVYGIFGIINLLNDSYIIVITDAELVSDKNDNHVEIYQMKKYNIFPFSSKKSYESNNNDEERYLKLLNIALETGTYYFSYNYDLTHSQQRRCDLSMNQALWMRADERFFWNKYLCDELIKQSLHDWILPIMNGYVYINSNALKSHNATYMLISRRSHERVGKRYTVRGLDQDGHAANFVETEQILIFPINNGQNTCITSYVQTRGSIPLYWRQAVTLKYSPKIEIFNDPAYSASVKHFEDQTKRYGRQICLSLVNLKGSEKKLSDAFENVVNNIQNNNVRLITWDFHKECKGMKYENIHKLIKIFADEFNTENLYFKAITSNDDHWTNTSLYKIKSIQKTVVRTNCMDCLDRTNVVQSVLARYLINCQLLSKSSNDSKVIPFDEYYRLSTQFFTDKEFEHIFKNVWANNADAMSLPYSGTGAQKTDYTRTGKRTKYGAARDLSYSLIRYYKNNFRDGDVQDGLDLLLGHHQLDEEKNKKQSPFKALEKHENITLFIGKLCIIYFILLQAFYMYASSTNTSSILVSIIAWLPMLLFPVIAFKLAERRGRKFVCLPMLGRLNEYDHVLKPSSSSSNTIDRTKDD